LKCAEGFRRLLVARWYILAGVSERFHHCRIGQGIDDRGIQAGDDRLWRSLGCPEPVPDGDIKSGFAVSPAVGISGAMAMRFFAVTA